MDVVLSGISVDGFKVIAVVLAALVGAGVYLGFFRKWYWALFAVTFTYMVVSAGIGVYVLMHFTDPRWSMGKEPLLQAPAVGDTPVVGELLRPLEGFLQDAATSINDLAAFRHALPVAQEFFALAGWALLLLIPVTIMALAVSRFKQATMFLRVERLVAKVNAQDAEIKALKRKVDGPAPETDPDVR